MTTRAKEAINKISVIMPTYNRVMIISKSIQSVLNQTHQNIELIIIDDGSTDNTETIIKDIKDKRIKYIKLHQNHGACYARNIGIKKSTGHYIAFQDSDDIFAKNKLEEQLHNLTKHKSDLDFCKICIHTGNYKGIIPNDNQEIAFKTTKLIDLLCTGNFISTQAILTKKEILEKLSFNPNLPRYQDYDLMMRIVAQKYKISYTNEILVNLYRQDDSISKSNQKLLIACQIMLNTDYGLDTKQKQIFTNTLLQHIVNASKEEIYELHSKTSQALYEIEEKYANLVAENKKLTSVLEETDLNLRKVLNSKSWKLINFTRKIIHPFK